MLDRLFCQTEIPLGRPCSCCSPTPMVESVSLFLHSFGCIVILFALLRRGGAAKNINVRFDKSDENSLFQRNFPGERSKFTCFLSGIFLAIVWGLGEKVESSVQGRNLSSQIKNTPFGLSALSQKV